MNKNTGLRKRETFAQSSTHIDVSPAGTLVVSLNVDTATERLCHDGQLLPKIKTSFSSPFHVDPRRGLTCVPFGGLPRDDADGWPNIPQTVGAFGQESPILLNMSGTSCRQMQE